MEFVLMVDTIRHSAKLSTGVRSREQAEAMLGRNCSLPAREEVGG